MGRFNLNQILSDTSKAAAGGGSAKPRPSESRYEKLSVFDLVPSEDNFYSMREIGELKAAIEIAGKVLQNLVVVPLGDGKYKVIAGHRRRLASIELVNDGKPEYEFVPCVIEPTEEAADEQEIRDGLDLIVTNSQREKTAWDKIEEVRYLREVLEKAKTKPRFVELLRRIVEKTFEDGELQTDGTRDFIAKVLHTSTTQIGRYGHLSSLHKVEAPVQPLHKPRQPRRISGVPACQQRKVGKHRLPVTCRRVNLRRLAEQSCLLSIEGKCHLHKRTGCAAQLTIHLHGYTVVRSHIRKQLPQDVAVPIDLRVDSVKTLRRCALSSAPVIKPHAASPLHGLYREDTQKAMHHFR